MLWQAKEKLERIGNARIDPDIKVTTLCISTKYHQFYPGGSFGRFVSHICCNLVHIYIKEGLWFNSRDGNHPVSDGIGKALRLLGCRASFHKEMLSHKMDQFG